MLVYMCACVHVQSCVYEIVNHVHSYLTVIGVHGRMHPNYSNYFVGS